MLEQDFKYLLSQFGEQVVLNDEINSRTAIISNRKRSDVTHMFDDKKIHCDFNIKRGDTITYKGIIFLAIDDVQSKRSFEYKTTLRPMTNTFAFTYMTEGYFEEYDRFGNPIWIIKPEEITDELPCIAFQEGNPTIKGDTIRQPEERIKVYMPDNYATQQIELDTKHQLLNRYYKIVDINLLQDGLCILTMEWTTIPA